MHILPKLSADDCSYADLMSSLILLATSASIARIGEWTSVFDNLEGPAAIAQHPEGGVVIADRLTGSIDRLVASGDLTLAEGFAGPEGVAVHATEGWMVVADTAVDQVHVVATGHPNLAGFQRDLPGQLCAPRGVAISPAVPTIGYRQRPRGSRPSR